MIRYDGRNLFLEREIEEQESRLDEIIRQVLAERKRGGHPFFDLPRADPRPLIKFAGKIRKRYENLVVLGIGGSALGTIALKRALLLPFYDLLDKKSRRGPRLFVLDNVDPEEVGRLLDLIDPKKTAVNVVTKSGSTTETLAHFAIFRSQKLATIFVTTDPQKGELREVALQEGYPLFEVPPEIVGRFSVLSPVGLLPAAIVGIDIRRLLLGAARMATEALRPAKENGPARAALGQHLSFTRHRRNILVVMPYAASLYGIAQWFAQLWAESLGKKGMGQTPVVTLGATDQHSQLQLYMEGPDDKTIQFWGCEKFRRDVVIPRTGRSGTLRLLAGHRLSELINIERVATEQSLTEARRPNSTILLSSVSPESIGGLLMFLQAQTLFAAKLYGVNPYNQPGVEAGKKIIHRELAREG